MRSLAALLVLLLAACGAPAGTQFKATVQQPDGSYPMPVVLGDQTGLVVTIESAVGENPDQRLPNVRVDPDTPSAVIVSWGTGACDDDTAISMTRSGAEYRLSVAVNEGFSMACTAQLLFRGLRIRLSEPVAAGEIVVEQVH